MRFIYWVIVALLLSSFAISIVATVVLFAGYAAYGVYPLSAILEGFLIIPSLLSLPLKLKSATELYFLGAVYWLGLIAAFLILHKRKTGP